MGHGKKGSVDIMKVFISQPMRGKTTEKIKEEREQIVKDLENQGYEVINSILDISEGKSPVYYLAKSLELLDEADCVVFMKGWQEARGCRIEHMTAVEYGKFIKELR